MKPIRILVPIILAGLAVGCSDKKAPAQPAAGVAQPETAATTAVAEPKEYQRVVYDCGGGRNITLRLFDDQRARVDIEGKTEVLRPVATEDGTLFLGDDVNVRIVGQQAIASRAGIVLLAGCKTQPVP